MYIENSTIHIVFLSTLTLKLIHIHPSPLYMYAWRTIETPLPCSSVYSFYFMNVYCLLVGPGWRGIFPHVLADACIEQSDGYSRQFSLEG